MTNSKQMKDVMGTLTEIISFVKDSPKRQNLLGNIKDLIHFASLHTDDEIEVVPTLDKLSATRWKFRGDAYKNKDSNYLSFMKLWYVSLTAGDLDSEMKARIIGVQSQRLFAISDNLSKTLQKESTSALTGLHSAELIVQTY